MGGLSASSARVDRYGDPCFAMQAASWLGQAIQLVPPAAAGISAHADQCRQAAVA